MSKFKIIEEGRVGISDMSKIVGGGVNPDCYQDTYRTIQECPGYTVYASCPISYYSCNTNGVVTCGSATGGHRGAPGGAGLITTITPWN